MIVKKTGEAADFKPQALGSIEPGQTFKVQVKFASPGSGSHKVTFQLIDGHDNNYFGPNCLVEFKVDASAFLNFS